MIAELYQAIGVKERANEKRKEKKKKKEVCSETMRLTRLVDLGLGHVAKGYRRII